MRSFHSNLPTASEKNALMQAFQLATDLPFGTSNTFGLQDTWPFKRVASDKFAGRFHPTDSCCFSTTLRIVCGGEERQRPSGPSGLLRLRKQVQYQLTDAYSFIPAR